MTELERFRAGSCPGPAKAPERKYSNWVPTSAEGKFEVLFRLYGSEKPLFDKTRKLPHIEKLK